jgi:hypothetical protein
VKRIFTENSLGPRYLKIRIQANVLEKVNFRRICEHRSKNLCLLHSVKIMPKFNKNNATVYGERTKVVYWYNSELVLVCHIKLIQDDSVLNNKLKNKRKNHFTEAQIEQTVQNHMQYLVQQQTQQIQDPYTSVDQNPEATKVEIVFKLIGQVQIIQKFVRDF